MWESLPFRWVCDRVDSSRYTHQHNLWPLKEHFTIIDWQYGLKEISVYWKLDRCIYFMHAKCFQDFIKIWAKSSVFEAG